MNLVFLYKKVSITLMKITVTGHSCSLFILVKKMNTFTLQRLGWGEWWLERKGHAAYCWRSPFQQTCKILPTFFFLFLCSLTPSSCFSRSLLNIEENKCHLWVTLLHSINYAFFFFFCIIQSRNSFFFWQPHQTVIEIIWYKKY